MSLSVRLKSEMLYCLFGQAAAIIQHMEIQLLYGTGSLEVL